MRPDDAQLTRRVRSEIIRRELDTTRLEVKVIHGVAYLAGELRPTRSQRIPDPKKEMEIIENIIYGISGIRGMDNRIKWIEL
jgi:osmotically-inducible protein OsmY